MSLDETKLHQLRYICQKVVNDPDLLPENSKGEKVVDPKINGPITRTFCNIAVNRICTHMGYDKLAGMLANQIYEHCAKEPAWLHADADSAHEAALCGDLALALLQGQPHGHCAVVYPAGPKIYSGRWQIYCPKVANVGARNGIIGANWAFRERPLYVILRRET